MFALIFHKVYGYALLFKNQLMQRAKKIDQQNGVCGVGRGCQKGETLGEGGEYTGDSYGIEIKLEITMNSIVNYSNSVNKNKKLIKS